MTSTKYQGSCHCGRVKFHVYGEIEQLMECNCSICSKRGYLLWFAGKKDFHPETNFSTLTKYQFGANTIDHMFCSTCGAAPVGFGSGRDGVEMVAINARCLDGVDLKSYKVIFHDGKKD